MTILKREQIGAAVHDWQSDRGRFRTERVARHVLLFRATGHLEATFVDLFEAVVNDAITDCKPHLFWDGQEMVGYETKFRQRIGAYCLKVKPAVSSMNVFTPNRFVAMGASVINVWLGGFFNVIRLRSQFDELLSVTKTSPIEKPALR